MKYQVRKTTLDDIHKIMPYISESGKVESDCLAETDESKVFLVDGTPMMIISLTYLPGGRDDVEVGIWGLFHKDLYKHTKQLVRVCNDLLFDRAGFVFYALIDENVPKFIRFAKFFGFVRTEIVERHDRKLYHMYVKRT